jgi:hypothetical protein
MQSFSDLRKSRSMQKGRSMQNKNFYIPPLPIQTPLNFQQMATAIRKRRSMLNKPLQFMKTASALRKRRSISHRRRNTGGSRKKRHSRRRR